MYGDLLAEHSKGLTAEPPAPVEEATLADRIEARLVSLAKIHGGHITDAIRAVGRQQPHLPWALSLPESYLPVAEALDAMFDRRTQHGERELWEALKGEHLDA